MAQTQEVTSGGLSAANTAVTVAQSGNTTLLDLNVEHISALGIDIAVTGQDLDAFVVQGKMGRDSAYQTLYSAAADFTSPAGAVIDASGDLTVLAAAASGWLMLNTLGLAAVKILASSGNVAGSTVTVRAIGKA